MTKKPIHLVCVSSDNYMLWQADVQLHNFRKYGYSENYHLLVYFATNRPAGESNNDSTEGWDKLKAKYPEASIHYYYDIDDILNTHIKPITYIPLLRPYCLIQHFTEFPELKDEVIFYHDVDILFTKAFPFEKYVSDDVCYLSDTGSYLNLKYLEGKIEQSPKRDELYNEKPIEILAVLNGITLDIIKENDEGTGGAQYLLKGIDAQFWKDVYISCQIIRPYLQDINKRYFESENAGYQSWCSDMWAVLWNLWKRKKKTSCPKDFDFSWATSPYSTIESMYIMHNAGVSNQIMELNNENAVLFYKGMYANNNSPFNNKKYLEVISPKYASKFYANELLEIKDPVF